MAPKLDYFSQEGFGLEQWEYWVEEISASLVNREILRLSDINKALNESGRLGWELVGIIRIKPQELLAFYRRKLVI